LALVAVTLRQSKLATQRAIAAAFGHSEATQRRWETRYRQHGAAGLLPRKPTGRPGALAPSQRACVRRWFEQGVSNADMARRLAVSEGTIRRVLRAAGLRRPTKPVGVLFADAVPAPAGAAPDAGATPVAVAAPGVAAPGLVPVAATVLPTSSSVPADATTATPITPSADMHVSPPVPVLLGNPPDDHLHPRPRPHGSCRRPLAGAVGPARRCRPLVRRPR
jgi:transposase